MSTIDWIFAGIVILAGIRCFVKGFVAEVLSVAAYAAGLLAAVLFSNKVTVFLAENLKLGNLNSTILYIIAFIICFILGFIIMKILEKLLREGLEAANLEIFDRIIGLALGLVEGLAFVSFILIILEMQTFFPIDKTLATSIFAKTLLPIVGPAITQNLQPALDSVGGQLKLDEIFRKK